jgi:drug/metabolite transporter (DMT)-like permease
VLSLYPLVVLSAVLHAYWNFILKERRATSTFVGLSKVAEVAIFAPAFIIALVVTRAGATLFSARGILLIAVGAVLTMCNYMALARAYHYGDLSLVYPVSRGAGLLFLPPLGFLVFGERLAVVGWVAIAMILAGLAVTQRAGTAAREGGVKTSPRAIAFALLAGLAAAGYTVWDKRAVNQLPAFVYFYAYSIFVAAAYGTFLVRQVAPAALADEWRRNRWPIVQVGVCNTVAYLLILSALRTGTSSYVIALRQLSIAFGVLLGYWRLHEPLTRSKRVGITLLLAGCALIALTR